MATRLLHRTTRRVQLTQDGLVYYDRCLDLLSMIDDMDSLFQHEPASLSGKLGLICLWQWPPVLSCHGCRNFAALPRRRD